MLKNIKTHWIVIIRSTLIAMGAIWLPLEAYEGLSNEQVTVPYYCFFLASILIGIGIFIFDGYYLDGFLRNRVEITSSGFDTKVSIIFGNLFSQNGWKAIGANDFFDSIVDEDLVSSNSLHGRVINTYWSDNREGWQAEVDSSLKDEPYETVARSKGNGRRFQIGTTAIATNDGERFLFVALGNTDIVNNTTTASAESLISATRGLLRKARTVCSNEPLNIPLMGSGLGRVGIRNAILVDLLLAAIFEETKQSKVTSAITIVLPNEKKSEIPLGNFSRDWN